MITSQPRFIRAPFDCSAPSHPAPQSTAFQCSVNSVNTASTSVDFSRNVVCVMGLPFDVLTIEEAVGRVRTAAALRTPLMVSTANLNFVVAARTDEAFRDSIIRSQLSLADGMPVVWVARLLGIPIRERVPGAELFEAIRRKNEPPAVKVFFFGGPEGAAEAASDRVNQELGGVCCVGFDYPGYVSIDAMSGVDHIGRINAANPDFIVVSLGAKKGQAWIERNRASLRAPVISHLGAVVNFAAGSVRRAPMWLQQIGMEWVWRIKEEPSLWQRYRSDGAAFLQIFVSNVVPLWWQQVRAKLGGDRSPPSVEAKITASESQLRLSGAFDAGNVSELRAALRSVAESATRVLIDLTGVVRLDSTSMGLILLLHGHQRGINQPLELHGASVGLQRQFRHHGTEFLLGSARKPSTL